MISFPDDAVDSVSEPSLPGIQGCMADMGEIYFFVLSLLICAVSSVLRLLTLSFAT
jgi:hypothetical protein